MICGSKALCGTLAEICQAEDDGNRQEGQCADNAGGSGADEGVTAVGGQIDADGGNAVDGTVSQNGGDAAAGFQRQPGEKDPRHDTETAHRGDAGEGIAGVAQPVIVSRDGQGCVPQTPDNAGDRQHEDGRKLLCHFGKQIAAPAPLFAEAGYKIQDRCKKKRLYALNQHDKAQWCGQRLSGRAGCGHSHPHITKVWVIGAFKK